MSAVRRVVFDTSTLVGAALKPGSVPHRALLQALARCDVCASAQTLLELEKVMQRDKFDRYLSREIQLDFVAVLRQNMHFFAVMPADEENLQPHVALQKTTSSWRSRMSAMRMPWSAAMTTCWC